MASLGELLCNHTDELVHRWYERRLRERPSSPKLTEAALKDHLPLQLRVIGGALLNENSSRESPHELWQKHGRLDPGQRVIDQVLIAEVVREYAFVVEEIRIWLEERDEQVSFQDYSFFHLAIFELTA